MIVQKNTRYLNSGNIFARAQMFLEFAKKNTCFGIITKQENIKKYLQIFQEFGLISSELQNIQDIGDMTLSKLGIFFLPPEIFESQTPNLYNIQNKSGFCIQKGDQIDISDLTKKLIDLGYVYRDFLEGGDFKRMGDVLHIKTRFHTPTISISFWGEEVEDISGSDGQKVYFGSLAKIDIFSLRDKLPSGLEEILKSTTPTLILDNIDTYATHKNLVEIENSISFDILKIAENKQTSLEIKDVYLEDIEKLKKIFEDKKHSIEIYSKSSKTIQSFLTQHEFENVIVQKTNLNILKSYQNKEKIVLCDDVLGKIFVKKRSKKSLSENLDLLLQIKSGDFVVHQDHGIGVFHGIIEKEVGQIKKEYLEIAYKDNDKLFVPITEVKRISKYVGQENPKLTGLNTKEWTKKLQKVDEDVAVIAEELLGIYAQRKLTSGFAFTLYPDKQEAFQQSFDYDYTPDQHSAIVDILQDMSKETPMERILVGDVGFGKTEVAMNALYNAYLNKKQAILISPLVVLAYEHYEKACERLVPFGVRVGVLTRFEKPEIAKRTIEALKKGEIDVIIGTHRVLNESIVYKDLGLLVIDEEHKFGVKEKETIKKLKENVDILSMSATPIPRSLNMALNGIKEVSILAHAPSSRLPIDTSISKFDDEIIKEVGHREFQRSGQLYFIHNRVETIESMQDHLQSLFPNKKIIITHGQLHGDELENRIIAFKQKKYDILLSSTVIENGIDFPNVNTIIINDAYKFGISQIHQLRGRVGRSDKQGYCLLLFSKDKIAEDAAKRLSTIVEYSHLGAGFELAVKDLEIRGGGDILGIKQSGKASEVGISLYLKMLEEKIEQLKYLQEQDETHLKPKKSLPTIDLNVEAYIRGDMFENELDKLNFYKEIETIHNFEELQGVIDEFQEKNEEIPPPTHHLFSLLKVRIQALEYNIVSIRRIGVSYHIDFYEDNTLENLKKFLDTDTNGYFSLVDMKKVKCLVGKFKNDTDFLHSLEKMLFIAEKPKEKIKKMIKLKKK